MSKTTQSRLQARAGSEAGESTVDLEELIHSLSRPEAFPGRVEEVQVLQTHISVLLFAGDRVYKLKKPIRLAFLDYTALDERRRFCDEEVRLNRRISPKMYLGVLPVTRDEAGAIRVDGDGETVDWVVEMVRLPSERMLDVLLETGEVGREEIRRVASVLVRFHGRAMTGPFVNQYGLAPAVAEELEENLDQLAHAAQGHPGILPSAALEHLRRRARRYPLEHRALLERRVAQWRIREGHGDLHAGNICLHDGEVYVYDCVEFEPRFRCGDVASDLAFLAMDLDHKGHVDASQELVRSYAEAALDTELNGLLPFYETYRALVRAKVQLVTAEDEGIAEAQRSAALDEARRYVHLALGYELPPSLVVTCGLPGVGKSFAAEYLAGRLRATLLRSDALRKAGGEGPSGDDAYGEGAYGAEQKEGVYRNLLEQAVASLKEGRSVVADATFSRGSLRRPFLDAAARLGVPCLVLLLDVPDAVARERIEARAHDPDEPSDADFEVYLHEKERFEPPVEVPDEQVVRGSGTARPQEHCQAVLERLAEQQESGGRLDSREPTAP